MPCFPIRSGHGPDFLAYCKQNGYPFTDSTVIRLGDSIPEAGIVENRQVADVLEKKFILFVSTIERRKNHEVLYRAYHLLCAANKGENLPLLVFVGMLGWGIRDLMSDIDLDPLTRGKIRILNSVSDGELSALYRHCLFTVYPSLYEGWGLPVAEALSLGKVVITTPRGSLPEIGGDLVDYADPWNPAAWGTLIEKYFRQPELVGEKEKFIKNRYVRSQWRDTARQVSEAADELIRRTA